MRERRTDARRPTARTASIAGIAAVGLWIWAKAAQRPIDSLVLLAAAALSLVIVVNAVFLQSGARRGPFFANPAPPAANTPSNVAGKSAASVPGAPASATVRAHTAAAGHKDKIAQLISSFVASSRLIAVQRVLSDFGYGQIRASGTLDEPTRAAIEKFERGHQMPVTGRVSERLVRRLAAMTGHPLDY